VLSSSLQHFRFAAFGESLEAGQIIIGGSITPPLLVEPTEELGFHLAPIDTISVRFAPVSRA
jgi:2-keto-4-pentenoate hydratase